MWQLSTTLTINRPHTAHERDFPSKRAALRYICRMARKYRDDGWMVVRKRGEPGFLARLDKTCCADPFIMEYRAKEV